MQPIDLRIMCAMIGVVSGVMSALIHRLRRNYPAQIHGMRAWSAGGALISASGFSFAVVWPLPPLILVLVGNGLMFAGFIKCYQGTLRFLDRDFRLVPWSLASAGLLGALVYFTLVEPDYRIRVVVFTVFTSAVCLAHSRILLALGRGISSSALAASLIGIVLTMSSRALFSFYTNGPESDRYKLSSAEGLYLLFFGALLLLSMTAAIVMFSEKVREEFAQLASHDSLTGCLNRRAMLEIGKQEHARWERHENPYSVLILDLDHFKSINDSHGHLMGDQVLKRFVETVGNTLRDFDTLGRFGGEEFFVILSGTTLDAALTIAERIRANVENQAGNSELPAVTVSIGVASVTKSAPGFDAMLSTADRALYKAKHAGRNRVHAECF